MLHILWRIGRVGIASAAVLAVSSWGIGRLRFGASDADTVARVEGELGRQFAASAENLGRVASQLPVDWTTVNSATHVPALARRLFDVVEAALPDKEAGRTGITLYNAALAPVAWAGRTSDLPKERTEGPAALFVTAGALGPRLVRVEPIVDRNRVPATRVATVVVEELLGRTRGAPGLTDTFTVSTSLVPVSLHVRAGTASPVPSQNDYAFVIPSADRGPLVDATVSLADLAAARARWRARTWAAALAVLGLTLLFCVSPLVDLRRSAGSAGAFLIRTATVVAAIVMARMLFWLAASAILGPRLLTSPLDLLLTALAFIAVVWVALDTVERWRIAGPRPRLLVGTARSVAWIGIAYAAAGVVATAMIWTYERFLRGLVVRSTLDLSQFSIHPMEATRLALAFSLVLLHAGIVWSAVVVTRLPSVWRTRRLFAERAAPVSWVLGVALAIGVARLAGAARHMAPLLVAVGATGAGSITLAHWGRKMRRKSQAARLWVVFFALFAPALAMYPSLGAFVTEAKERAIATEYGPQVAHQREDVQKALYAALDEIDARRSLGDLVTESGEQATPTADRAFLVWSGTDLNTHRLTSALELYGADGRLVSRYFAPNLPEYATTSRQATGCQWEAPIDELLPLGSSQRHVLRTSRGICERGRAVGAIAVSVMLDYQTLPFIESHSPYFELLGPERARPTETAFEHDVEFVVYGWNRAPAYTSGTGVWPLSDAVFQRLVASRAPFWETVSQDVAVRVFFMSDRGNIYALGYPVTTWPRHLVNVAELVFLTGVAYILLLVGVAIIKAVTSQRPTSGRALLREIRASFYRKLFLAFVAAAVAPVLMLAFLLRTYLETQLTAGLEETAAKTALVAQRLVEDYATLEQRGTNAPALDDQVMLLVRRAIDEDVNLFERTQLVATSERPLFASGFLSTRTPSDVYRHIVLDRTLTYVGEERIGDSPPYLLAAAPVRAGTRESIVTVPITLRQQEIERQIDDLDRRLLSAAVLFSLLGAALGYGMAERIADPINRLTRATRRIARGNLDARVLAATSDELGRLIDDFNRMADDLKRQRAELERTQRLEAWAHMARQVAHDIKNPLTPIQLSAEHARRVNIDRGRPLSPVLDDCINAILSQVRLLRQIAAEFTSFASPALPRPEATELSDLLEEVVGPYRSGLAGRIALEVRVPENLPALDVDRTLLGRAFTNIIENALHAMPGTGTLRIGASRRSTPGDRQSSTTDGQLLLIHDSVIIEFSDTGIGMDPESAARIFEPYFSTKATGTGLGLTIAKRNVELNHGTIEVRSQKGVGTTVTMTLPLKH